MDSIHCPVCGELLLRGGIYHGKSFDGDDDLGAKMSKFCYYVSGHPAKDDAHEWYIVHDIFAFENMAFSKKPEPSSCPARLNISPDDLNKCRLLCCPTCNTGPLGFGIDDGESSSSGKIYAIHGQSIQRNAPSSSSQ